MASFLPWNYNKQNSAPQNGNKSNSQQDIISLPKLVKCRSKFNCGLWGRDDMQGLCTKCYYEYDSRLTNSTKQDVINWLLEKQGLKNLNDACVAYARELVYAKEERVDPKKIPGVLTWKTIYTPKTQYDVFPEKGHSACTYISGCAVLMALLAKDEPDAEVWSSCIKYGVKAFHSAREVDVSLAGNVCLSEILGYLLVTMDVDTKHADFIHYNDTYCLLSSNNLDVMQKKSLLAAGTLFSILELNEYFKKVLAKDWSGVVITRPPETWSVVRGAHGQIYLRDSHRLLQYDFNSLETFVKFVEVDNGYFVPMPGFGVGGNQISLTEIIFSSTLSNDLMERGRILSIDHHTSFENIGKKENKEKIHTLPTEIIKNRLYLSDVHIARDFNALQSTKITHILNLTGPGSNGHPRYFNKFQNDYSERKYTYLHICNVYDSNILYGGANNKNMNRKSATNRQHDRKKQHCGKGNNNHGIVFDNTNDTIDSNSSMTLEEYINICLIFVQRALRSDPRHRVLIHCENGTNLSAGITIAYLLLETEHTLKSSLELLNTKLIANVKKIQPDMGTLLQLLPVELRFKKTTDGRSTLQQNTISVMDIQTIHISNRLNDMGFNVDALKIQTHLKHYRVSEVEALLVEEAILTETARKQQQQQG
jgi:hypothetical protein